MRLGVICGFGFVGGGKARGSLMEGVSFGNEISFRHL